jgi:hypothetical protein
MSFSLLLVNLTENSIAQYLGVLFTVVGMTILLWSLILFHMRASGLRVSDASGPYDSPYLSRTTVVLMLSGIVLASVVGWTSPVVR